MWTRFITWAYIVLPVLALYASPEAVLFPTTHGKTLLWAMLISILTAVYVWSNKIRSWAVSPLVMTCLAYLISMGISAVLGVDRSQSMWGTDTRGFGIWIWIWLVVYVSVLAHIFSEERGHTNKRIYQGTIAVFSVLIIFPAASEVAREGVHRTVGVFGNPLLYANVALFPLFFGVYTAIREKKIAWRIAGTVSAVLGATGVILTQSRGAFIAMIAGCVVTAAMLIWRKLHIKQMMIIGTVALVVFVGAYVNRTSTPAKVLGLDRALSIFSLDASTSQRLIVWNSALQAWGTRPMFGWGPENFDYAFDRFFDPRNESFGLSQTWSDRAHNTLIDALVMQGIVGAIIYVFIFVLALNTAYKKWNIEHRAYGAIIGLIVAYGVQSMTVFDSPATAVLWMGTLAYIASGQGKKYAVSRLGHGLLSIAASLCAVGTIWIIGRSYSASSLMAQAENTQETNVRVEAIRQSLNVWSPHRHSLYQRAANMLFGHADRNRQTEAAIQLQLAIDIMQEAIVKYPHKFSFQFTLGNVLTKTAFILDKQFSQQADAVLEASSRLSPRRTAVYFQRANLRVLWGDYDAARAMLDEALRIYPESKQAHYMRGIALTFTDHEAEGLSSIMFAMDAPYAYRPTVVSEMDHVLRIALMHGDIRLASRLMALLAVEDPLNEERWYNVTLMAAEAEADDTYIYHQMDQIRQKIQSGKLDESLLERVKIVEEKIENKKGLP